MCDGTAPSPWTISAVVALASTDIEFPAARVGLSQRVASVSVSRFATPRVGWALSVGGILDGSVERREIHGGGSVAASVTWLPLFEKERRPFFAVTASLSASHLRAEADDGSTRGWTAVDVRVGGTVGKTFGPVTPFASARVFGGPVRWRLAGQAVTGSDRYHVTLGAGATLRLPGRWAVSTEIMPLGEQAASLAVSKRL